MKKLDMAPQLTKACAQCPWRLENQGKRHFGSFYSKVNLKRLWNQIRRGGGVQSCHLTDPQHPDHILAGAKPGAEPKECPGSVIVVSRELRRIADKDGVLDNPGLKKYLKERKKFGLTRTGLQYWIMSRIQLGGVPFVGGPKIPDVKDDPEIGLPKWACEG